MRRKSTAILYWFAALALSAVISAAPAHAQSQPISPDQDTDHLTSRQLAAFDQFLDSHPEVAEQVRKNPSLVNNEEFVENHAALQRYLQEHPEVREDLAQNPNAVMHQEQRFDRREDGDEDRDRRRGDGNMTRGEMANMDRFMDGHPEIAEQLRKNPALVNNKDFVEDHPALQQFLASHPEVREEYKEHPEAFLRQEQRFDRREDFVRRDRDVTGGELSSFHEFLGAHNNISGDLSKNPSLATNEEYLESHSALRDYLKANPKVKEELGENPQSFLKSAQQFEMPGKMMPKPVTEPKLK